MPEVVPGDAKRTYNTAVVIDPRGELLSLPTAEQREVLGQHDELGTLGCRLSR
jgi:hypothetical protein